MVLRSICVFCGARPGHDPAHAVAAVTLGRTLAEQGIRLVYGGGAVGLMGIVADAALAAGGRVVGVIPRALVELEHAHRGCTELIVVETMHERKRIMAERCDAFLALPGGIGTFEEFFETWTWRQLGYHDKPTGLLNQNGYYDALLGFLRHSVASGFMGESQMALIEVDPDWQNLLQTLVRTAGFPSPTELEKI